MVSFSCESCCDVLVKKKLDAHVGRCPGARFTCLDCSTTFTGTSYREHTSCISEAQKYQKSVYRPEKKKGKDKGKDKGTDTDKTKTDHGHQGSQNESGGTDVGSQNGKVKSGETQSEALGPGEGDTTQTDKQKEPEEEKDKLAKEHEAKAHDAKEESKTVDNGGDKKKETKAVKNTKEKGDKKRKRKSSEVVVSEEDEGPADKLKRKKKGEVQEGEVKKQPKDKKSKNKDPKKSEEKPSVLPAVVPPPETSHQPDTASIPSTTVNENNAPQPPTIPTPTPAPSASRVDPPPSQALSSQHLLNSIPAGKDILMVRLIKKLKKTGSENEIWELLKRAKVAKDNDGKVVLTLQ